MANVKTFNLSIFFIAGELTFRGISRVAVERYKKYYAAEYSNPYFNVEAR